MTCSPMTRTFLPDKSSGRSASPKSGRMHASASHEGTYPAPSNRLWFSPVRAACRMHSARRPDVLLPTGVPTTQGVPYIFFNSAAAGNPTADTTKFTSARPASRSSSRPLSMAQHPTVSIPWLLRKSFNLAVFPVREKSSGVTPSILTFRAAGLSALIPGGQNRFTIHLRASPAPRT